MTIQNVYFGSWARWDGIARAALINVSYGSGLLRRSISHLIPIEVEAGTEMSTRSAPITANK